MKKHTVKDIVKLVGPLPFRLIGKWMIQICNGLKSDHNSHSKDAYIPVSPLIIHISRSLDVELPDFQVLSNRSGRGTGPVTPAYWSPEQTSGMELSIRSTLYSLGVMAYEMITGTLPSEGDVLKPALFMSNMKSHGFKPSFKRPSIPPTLDLIVVKLLSKEPGNRFNSPDEIAEIISRMTLNEDETGVKAAKMVKEVLGHNDEDVKIPTLSMKRRMTGGFRTSPSNNGYSKAGESARTLAEEAGRTTLRLRTAVYQGPPEWEKNLNVVAEVDKVVLTWTTNTAERYKCKVIKRGSSESFISEIESREATFHRFELPGLEPDTGYSATIYNEKDFVMKSFKTCTSSS